MHLDFFFNLNAFGLWRPRGRELPVVLRFRDSAMAHGVVEQNRKGLETERPRPQPQETKLRSGPMQTTEKKGMGPRRIQRPGGSARSTHSRAGPDPCLIRETRFIAGPPESTYSLGYHHSSDRLSIPSHLPHEGTAAAVHRSIEGADRRHGPGTTSSWRRGEPRPPQRGHGGRLGRLPPR
jgi:hypothetical protein